MTFPSSNPITYWRRRCIGGLRKLLSKFGKKISNIFAHFSTNMTKYSRKKIKIYPSNFFMLKIPFNLHFILFFSDGDDCCLILLGHCCQLRSQYPLNYILTQTNFFELNVLQPCYLATASILFSNICFIFFCACVFLPSKYPLVSFRESLSKVVLGKMETCRRSCPAQVSFQKLSGGSHF